jgi:hypothetical protein
MPVFESLRRPHFHRALSLAARSTCLVVAALPAAAVPGASRTEAPPQGERTGRPDQVLYKSRRGEVGSVNGVVVRNDLSKVVVEVAGAEPRELEWDTVERVTFGDVPAAFVEARAYVDRGDFENAAAQFRLAAGDVGARGVVQAAARLAAAEALLSQGAVDRASFSAAREEAERFLADHPQNRDVPLARMVAARAARLSGDAAGAAELYRSIYREVAGAAPTPGYRRVLGFRAGLEAAESYLAAGAAAQAREIYAEMETLLPRALAELDEGDARRAQLAAIQSEARLGEGYVLLASKSTAQAKTFFQGQLRSASPHDWSLRSGAHLGLAEALLAEGDTRRARFEFASVSAMDHVDRGRVARALVGLAECALALADAGDPRTDVKRWLDTVRERYGDTPAVLKAQELAQNL